MFYPLLRNNGYNVASGYLINEKQNPGGGGLLIIESKNYQEAKNIIKKDPMILNHLVTWKLQEWVPVVGNFLDFNVDIHS